MSGITFIRRDQNDGVNIVRIIAESTLSQVGTNGYITAQAANIAAFNNSSVDSPFDWQASDMVLVYATDGWGFFTISADFGSLTAFAMSPDVIGTPVTIGHIPSFQSTSGNLQDSGIAAVNVQTSSLTNPDAISDLIWKDIALPAASLASAGSVTIQVSSGAKQYKVRDIRMNYSASGLSGGGGDRLVQITDSTTVFNNAGITAALLGTPVNTIWGGTGNPLAGTVAMNTSSVAGTSIVAKYAGGTADFTTGTVNISVLVQRVA